MTRRAYLEAAERAAVLLGDPAVAAAWAEPSALPKLSVRGLAGHLARQVTRVPGVVAAPASGAQPIGLLGHYSHSSWVTAGIDDEPNVSVRTQGEAEAPHGPAELAERVAAVVADLRETLPAEPADRVVVLPWTGWALSLDDFLTTRTLEIAVHLDDLAVSVGVPTPELPESAVDTVVTLLARLSVRRHGATAVLRALSRAERAPATIAAI